MILHVSTVDKFIPSFVQFVNEEFNQENHQFWLLDSKREFSDSGYSNVYVAKNTILGKLIAYALLLIKLHTAKKIVLHGLFNTWIINILSFCPWLLPKCYWVIWGGDLHRYQKKKSGLRENINEGLRKFVIRRIGNLVTYIKGDLDLARKWYGAEGEFHECLMYLSNIFDPSLVQASEESSRKPDGLNILVGNSADPSNNHINVLEKLRPYKNENIKIFAPLSYGDQKYAAQLMAQGDEWFGNKFVPLTRFMSFDQYLRFLSSLSLAIFNHERQQAMGNIITLLGMGKTVFMRSNISSWTFLRGLGIELKDVSRFSLQLLESDSAANNSRIVQSYFSRETLKRQLSEIFEESDGLSFKQSS
ncbi:TDP-N-acetylfucosamine:lipid II N-acetylfucosaminyltransferase [Marinobacter changyiensis]|uniref:TDP-N-acetylfucosamine:lipid II N-acetylfucosaminyltransferase n=1 Tax=Marinobacter changyiensis TaxID=2604091 RepID=UPI001265912A|nr:TDP-N-acetylfucosamine:lipid II N-acetylfucosaminyltransferase [Marinobacter changyiensis]